ncbi:splicing factor 3A subunit 1 [Halyomorpha halys]|uniref:splicing factor 3A subunit 1 n=1 Tax=Halyomorpha halys TaxID=286706 RepID=UPI0006D51609
MPSIDVIQPPPPPPMEKEEPLLQPTTKPIVGIIYPPPEVRNIVDKTASFVARNGPEFESRIRQNELGNPKFNFLNTGDPYHAYYQHKVKEFKEGKGAEPVPPPAPVQQKTVASATQLKQQEILKQVTEQPFVPKDPPPDYEFMADPPSISALDLDIVKLTAQFVARNGRQFLTNLMNREQRNYQFDFLRPQHSLFLYFTKLLEQYTKVLIPPKDLMSRLKEECSNPSGVLEQVRYRADWLHYQELQKRKEEQALEKERVAYAQIDWHDFVVVETVDYIPGEVGNFPPPTTPDEVGARVLMQERILENGGEDITEGAGSDEEREKEDNEREEAVGDKGDNTQVQDMEEESSSDSEEDDERESLGEKQQATPSQKQQLQQNQSADGKKPSTQPSMQPPLPPAPDKVIVKKGYNPKQNQKTSKGADNYLISPLTSEKIPANKVQEHMRIGLLDPRWVEQRDKHIQDRINQETVYAGGSAIEASLKQLAERRTDIFGVGDEETAIGKKIGEEDKKKDDKVTWDGHTSSVEAATRAARANITIEEQIHQIHKVKGLLPDEEKEKIGPKPVPGSVSTSTANPIPGGPPIVVQAKAPPLPPPPKVPPLPPPAPLPPPPGLVPQPPIMMVPAPLRPPLMVPPGAFPVVAATPSAFMAPPGTAPLPPAPQPPPQVTQVGNLLKHVASAAAGDADEEPMTKKPKTEDCLLPEAQFLMQHKSPVTFKVVVPLLADKPEWKLNGQALTFTLPLTDTIASVKANISETIGMPAAKQKLQCDGIFYKDSNSLAFYNISPNTVVYLQLKERGGRKK